MHRYLTLVASEFSSTNLLPDPTSEHSLVPKVQIWGMSERLGVLSYDPEKHQNELDPPYSQATAKLIDGISVPPPLFFSSSTLDLLHYPLCSMWSVQRHSYFILPYLTHAFSILAALPCELCCANHW